MELRGAGMICASVALAGGVSYLIWNYASSPRKKQGTRQEQDRERDREDVVSDEKNETVNSRREVEEEIKEVEKNELVSIAAAPVATAPKTAESRTTEATGTQILFLGLDGAGKSSLLQCFASGSLEQDIEPTQGFNAVSINRDDLHIEFLEIGGKEELRQYWQKYMSKALMLVFVVDSSKPKLFPLAKKHLHELLTSDPSLPLMVLAHKQDLPGALSLTDIHDSLSLSEIGDRRLFHICTHVKKGDPELSSGVQDARDLIIQTASEGR